MRPKGIVYPRPLFRTRRSSMVYLLVICAVMVSAFAIRVTRASHSVMDFVSLAMFALVPLGLAWRVLATLRGLEQQRSEADAVMILLLDMSILVPTSGLLFVMFALRVLD